MSKEVFSEYVASPHGSNEWFATSVPKTWGRYEGPDYQRFAEDAVAKLGLTTPRYNPEKIEVKIFGIKTEKGEVKRISLGNYKVQPPLAPMTHEEYREEMDSMLSGLPKEFHTFVENQASERDSSGYETTVSFAEELAIELERVFKAYVARKQIKEAL